MKIWKVQVLSRVVSDWKSNIKIYIPDENPKEVDSSDL